MKKKPRAKRICISCGRETRRSWTLKSVLLCYSCYRGELTNSK